MRVRREILACVAMSGCGFQSSAGPGDGGSVDASAAIDAGGADAAISDGGGIDAAVDAPGTPDDTCWPRWLAGDVALEAPVELTPLATAAGERDPWISQDGRSLYFGRSPGTLGLSDIFLATRTATTQPFTQAAEVTVLNTNLEESHAALSEDERTLVLSSNRGGRFEIFITTRAGRDLAFPPPGQVGLSKVNGPPTPAERYDPFLTGDGRTLYLAPDLPGEAQHVWFSTFDAASSEFATPVKVPGINAAEPAGDADPALSLDERVILFTSNRAGGAGSNDVYYATRADPGQTFRPPVRIPTVNSASNDGDPMLSADGCELYFASTRNGGDFDLFVARVRR